MLARFAALLEPPVRPVVSATVDAMKELHGARRALVKDRVAACNRDHTRRSPLLKRQVRARLRQIERQLAAIDAALYATLAADPALQARFDIPWEPLKSVNIDRTRPDYKAGPELGGRDTRYRSEYTDEMARRVEAAFARDVTAFGYEF